MTAPSSTQDHFSALVNLQRAGWTTVYSSWHDNDDSNGGSYSAFAGPRYRETAVGKPDWD